MTPPSQSDAQQSTERDAQSSRWTFWQAIAISLITSLTTVAVAYITVVKPGAKDAAAEETDRKLKELAVPVAITADDAPRLNNSKYRLLVFGGCNATPTSKVIEARTGETPEQMPVVASESGTDRIGITFLVPPGWYYRVKYDHVPEIGCDFSGSRF